MTDAETEETRIIQRKHLNEGLMHYDLPLSTSDGLMDWVLDHREPGGFLESVLRNDLSSAVGRADPSNSRKLIDIVRFLYNWVPSACWGSDERYENWKYRPIKE